MEFSYSAIPVGQISVSSDNLFVYQIDRYSNTVFIRESNLSSIYSLTQDTVTIQDINNAIVITQRT